jgi:hypothetical protein
MGWSLGTRERNPRGYAICGRCTVTTWSFEQAFDRAKRARKRK